MTDLKDKIAEILTLPPSPLLDKIILKRVYGLDPAEGDTIPPFSTSDADAILMAQYLSSSEEWNEHPFELHRNYAFKNMWTASFNDYKYKASSEHGLAHAVSLAAVLATLPQEDEK